ncbi:MAG: hypothetical protein ING61_05770 [Rhodocyclaceae bacterium]|nr:hypothetical protein [Rhodocyclaceae bacterium]
MWIHLVTTGLIDGAGGAAAPPPVEAAQVFTHSGGKSRRNQSDDQTLILEDLDIQDILTMVAKTWH